MSKFDSLNISFECEASTEFVETIKVFNRSEIEDSNEKSYNSIIDKSIVDEFIDLNISFNSNASVESLSTVKSPMKNEIAIDSKRAEIETSCRYNDIISKRM